jgi:hypothetical protein
MGIEIYQSSENQSVMILIIYWTSNILVSTLLIITSVITPFLNFLKIKKTREETEVALQLIRDFKI